MKKALCILLCFLPVFVSAQINNIKIETSYDSTAFLDFARKIEKEYAIKFYFNKAWLDTVKVKQNHVPTYLGPLLDESFKGLNLNYLIDGQNIIITKNYKIINKLSESFFKREDYNGINPSDTIDLKSAFIEPSKKKTPDLSSGPINIGVRGAVSKGDAGIVSGTVLNDENGEPIIGAQVYVKSLGKGTITDIYGNYSISLPKGKNEILFRSFGSTELVIPVMVYKDETLNVSMKEKLVQLNEVVVRADIENRVKSLSIGVQSLNMKEIKQLPLFMGEADIIKSAILLPGVQTVGEGASGFNVRGGQC